MWYTNNMVVGGETEVKYRELMAGDLNSRK